MFKVKERGLVLSTSGYFHVVENPFRPRFSFLFFLITFLLPSAFPAFPDLEDETEVFKRETLVMGAERLHADLVFGGIFCDELYSVFVCVEHHDSAQVLPLGGGGGSDT